MVCFNIIAEDQVENFLVNHIKVTFKKQKGILKNYSKSKVSMHRFAFHKKDPKQSAVLETIRLCLPVQCSVKLKRKPAVFVISRKITKTKRNARERENAIPNQTCKRLKNIISLSG